jgi:uncharacterized protein
MPVLHPPRHQPLPLGSIEPGGWLRNQLRIQADGLTGHLDEFWPDIKDSKWIGGDAEGWERGPYWLDGLVPLAYLLDDDALKAKVDYWIGYILDHQAESGWLGPNEDKRDPWPVFLLFKSLIQYHQYTANDRVIPAMMKAVRCIDLMLDGHMLTSWANHRWPDLVWTIQWLIDQTGDEWLVWFMNRAIRQGYDWKAHFTDLPWKEKTSRWTLDNHVVNHAMALKTAAVLSRITGEHDDAELAGLAVETMDRYHGQVTGVFSGDETLAGTQPFQGTELCSVVEYLFSLEVMLSVLGESWMGDRLEKIAFNALPATFSPDMWAHQYDQQANQVVCHITEDQVYTNNDGDANIYGLEPHFGCCTSNMHQGWPKFAAHLWMAESGGLVAMSYAPCTVATEIDGTNVTVTVGSDYPFSSEVSIRVEVGDPLTFPLRLRIPSWAEGAEISVEDETTPATPGEFAVIDREWSGETVASLNLPMTPIVVKRPSGGVAIERGPLVYSLLIGDEWKRVNEDDPMKALPHGDWEVHPTTPWNFAPVVDPANPGASLSFDETSIGDCPFSPDGAPVRAHAKGVRVPEWIIEHGAAGPVPTSVTSTGDLEGIILIPYGCTNLRISEFPSIE